MLITTRKKVGDLTIGSLKLKVTQKMIKFHSFGHYKWVIEDRKGNILACGSSWGSPPNKLSNEEILLIYERWRRNF